jgi:hypothetical protein
MTRSLAIATGLLMAWCLAAPALSAPAAGAGSARAFVDRVVHSLNMTTDGPEAWEKLSRKGGYDPSLLRLMDENDHLAQGVDLLDADPLCQCQDVGGHYAVAAFTQTGPDDATARIKDADGAVTAVLKRTGGAWHVYDVIDSGGSLRTQLTSHNLCMRRFHADADVVRCFGGR